MTNKKNIKRNIQTVGDLRIGDKIFYISSSDNGVGNNYYSQTISAICKANRNESDTTVNIKHIDFRGDEQVLCTMKLEDCLSVSYRVAYFVNENRAPKIFEFLRLQIIKRLQDEIEEREQVIKDLRKTVKVKPYNL